MFNGKGGRNSMEKQSKNDTWFTSFSLKKSSKKLNVKYLGILLTIGVFFMVVGIMMQDDNGGTVSPVMQEEGDEVEPGDNTPASVFNKSDDRPDSAMSEYEDFYESQLEQALEQVVGISDVSVFVNLEESEKTVYQTNKSTKEQITEETDREGGSRNVEDRTNDEEVVIIRNGDKEEPLVERIEKPSIRGVLVVAKGVENIQVKTWVIEAVSRALDVPSHRVSVLPKNSKGES